MSKPSPQPQEALESSGKQKSKQFHHSGNLGVTQEEPPTQPGYQRRPLGAGNSKAGALRAKGLQAGVQHLQRPEGIWQV